MSITYVTVLSSIIKPSITFPIPLFRYRLFTQLLLMLPTQDKQLQLIQTLAFNLTDELPTNPMPIPKHAY
jgi:hypothetical protein